MKPGNLKPGQIVHSSGRNHALVLQVNPASGNLNAATYRPETANIKLLCSKELVEIPTKALEIFTPLKGDQVIR